MIIVSYKIQNASTFTSRSENIVCERRVTIGYNILILLLYIIIYMVIINYTSNVSVTKMYHTVLLSETA